MKTYNNMREKKISFDLRFYFSITFDTLATVVGKVVMVVGEVDDVGNMLLLLLAKVVVVDRLWGCLGHDGFFFFFF